MGRAHDSDGAHTDGDEGHPGTAMDEAERLGMPPGAEHMDDPDEPGGLVTNTEDEAPSG